MLTVVMNPLSKVVEGSWALKYGHKEARPPDWVAPDWRSMSPEVYYYKS